MQNAATPVEQVPKMQFMDHDLSARGQLLLLVFGRHAHKIDQRKQNHTNVACHRAFGMLNGIENVDGLANARASYCFAQSSRHSSAIFVNNDVFGLNIHFWLCVCNFEAKRRCSDVRSTECSIQLFPQRLPPIRVAKVELEKFRMNASIEKTLFIVHQAIDLDSGVG